MLSLENGLIGRSQQWCQMLEEGSNVSLVSNGSDGQTYTRLIRIMWSVAFHNYALGSKYPTYLISYSLNLIRWDNLKIFCHFAAKFTHDIKGYLDGECLPVLNVFLPWRNVQNATSRMSPANVPRWDSRIRGRETFASERSPLEEWEGLILP